MSTENTVRLEHPVARHYQVAPLIEGQDQEIRTISRNYFQRDLTAKYYFADSEVGLSDPHSSHTKRLKSFGQNEGRSERHVNGNGRLRKARTGATIILVSLCRFI